MEFAMFLICFAVLFVVGMPIGLAMLFSAWLYAVATQTDLAFLTLEMFSSLDSFVLMAIPMFILTAEVMNVSTVADRIFRFANALVGFIPGGLGHVNVVNSVIFGGMSGSAAADAGGIGYLSYKAMVDRGFDKPFSAAVTASSSMIGAIIPPSIPMVIYAMVAGTSVGQLFLGGIVPGFMMGIAMMIVIYFVSLKRSYPVEARTNFRGIIAAMIGGFLPLMTPVILLGGIVLGIVTISEAAVLAVLYSCFLGFVLYRTLDWKQFIASLRSVFVSCGAILLLFPATKLFGYVLTVENIPRMFADTMLNLTDNGILLILLINAFFLILGCFSDPIVNIMLFVPIVLPLMATIGMDPIQFGVMIVLNVTIGLITPPLGGMLFITSAVTKVPVESMVKESWPFIGVLIITLLLISFIPPLVLFIPRLFA